MGVRPQKGFQERPKKASQGLLAGGLCSRRRRGFDARRCAARGAARCGESAYAFWEILSRCAAARRRAAGDAATWTCRRVRGANRPGGLISHASLL
eukprot:326160-Chlamydomonas_euryale.AAC.5